MRDGQRGGVKAAHRVADDDRPRQAFCVQHLQRIGDEVIRRVSLRGLWTVAVTARVRRDQTDPSGHRVGKELPVAAVVPDPVHEQRVRCAAPPVPHRDAAHGRPLWLVARLGHDHSLNSLAS
jgi:hypothetical protein